MRITLQPADESRRIQDATSSKIADAIARIGRLVFDGKPTLDAEADLGREIAEAMTWADLLARRRCYIYLANVTGTATTAYAMFGFQMPRVPFLEAIKDFFSRVPAVAKKAAAVAEVYARHGFAVARAATVEVTKKVHGMIGRSLVEGVSRRSTVEQIAQVGDFSRAYAETVYRTSVATAYTAGTLQEMQEPVIRDVVPALAYTAVHDANARANHLAADGLIAAEDDPIWADVAPPCGYNCRCGLRFVTHDEAVLRGVALPGGGIRRATIPPGFYRDPGFQGGRPDRLIYPA